MKKNFVVLLLRNMIVADEEWHEVPSWDLEIGLDMAKSYTDSWGRKPYAFYFITKERSDSDLDSKITKTSVLCEI